jgi:hypothetical protein
VMILQVFIEGTKDTLYRAAPRGAAFKISPKTDSDTAEGFMKSRYHSELSTSYGHMCRLLPSRITDDRARSVPGYAVASRRQQSRPGRVALAFCRRWSGNSRQTDTY